MGSESSSTKIPKINFSGLELSNPGTEAWEATRAKVMQSLDTVGFFTAVFDEISGELRDELFGPTVSSLFSVPHEHRMKTAPTPDRPQLGYNSWPGYESFYVDGAQKLDSVQAFANLMWPQGNPSFCDTLWRYARKLSEMELMVRRMILEGLGLVEHFSSHVESTRQSCRLTEYDVAQKKGNGFVLPIHKDPNLVTIIYQTQNDGLDLLSKGGEWLLASPNSFTVLTGDSFEAWSNGRVKSTAHRVKVTVHREKRYSVLLGSRFADGCMMEVLEELVNDEHPKLFNPFEYISYMLFRNSEQGKKANDPLKVFCGVKCDDQVPA